MPKLENALQALTADGIIEPVEQPKSWSSNIVVVEKPDKQSVRICLDPMELNKNIQREYCLIPTLDEIKSNLANKKIFSVIYLKDGFYHVPLSKESKELCTFGTPFGHYQFTKLPFSLTSAPEVFMRETRKCFAGIEDVSIYIDAIIIASDEQSHIAAVEKVFKRAVGRYEKFNLKKFQFMKKEIKYLGFKFSEHGSQPDEDRIRAVQHLKSPSCVKELQFVQFLTFVHTKYI